MPSATATTTTAPAAPAPYPAQVGEYEGKPMLILKRDANDRWPFQFQLAKAKLIVAHIDAIRKFVTDYDK